MSPTEQIKQALNQDLLNEPTNKFYKCFNTGGVEVEVGEFLYGFVRMIKPIYILETGTHKGVSASYMGLAMKENALSGRLDTIEYEEQNYKEARDLFEKLGIQDYIYGYKSLVEQFYPNNQYDLLFLDTEPGLRYKELIRFYPFLKEGGFALIHDLPRGFCKGNINPDHPEFIDWPWGPVPDEIKTWLKEGKLVKWHFPTPREICGFYKVRKDDYVAD